jgi:LPXTG-motif cell wall-anchored protein
MRRALAVAILALVLVVLVAAPAMAQQRDPFQPLIDPNAPVVAPGDPAPGTDPDTAPPFQPNEQVPNTGADTSSWFGLAYALIAIGAGLVVLARLYRHPGVTRRRA